MHNQERTRVIRTNRQALAVERCPECRVVYPLMGGWMVSPLMISRKHPAGTCYQCQAPITAYAIKAARDWRNKHTVVVEEER